MANGDGESVRECSKYERFLVPVVCEWTNRNGEVCGAHFIDVPTFSSHVRKHCEIVVPSFCAWSGCEFVAADQDLVLQHILYHPFHVFLKIVGAEYQAKYQLPPCQIDAQYKNLVPTISTPLKCQWNDGQCAAGFDFVGDFFLHMRDHVMGNDTGSSRCRWKGLCMKG